MKTMKDYHLYHLYLKCDILLLADVFEKFRNNTSLKNYGLCPSHYLNAPGPDMYTFFGKVMRGGVFYISNRYSKVNNKYLKSHDPKEESKHIIYLDTNNLYGYAMFKFHPTSGFKLIDPKEFHLNKYTNNSLKG